ncbi:hypothetical protein [Nocardioides sp. Root1257]|uniref:hypothetical protein n=1 Tax=Nocardioides sp. Root1257 TaxID=1736439 RepID=UPI00138F8D44|nr:hypothetical protein [Nocardioides sp. Root1257]
MTALVSLPLPGHRARAVVACPTCHHDDLAERSSLNRLSSVLGHPRTCATFGDEYVSPLRNESCGCDDPLHSVGQRANR